MIIAEWQLCCSLRLRPDFCLKFDYSKCSRICNVTWIALTFGVLHGSNKVRSVIFLRCSSPTPAFLNLFGNAFLHRGRDQTRTQIIAPKSPKFRSYPNTVHSTSSRLYWATHIKNLFHLAAFSSWEASCSVLRFPQCVSGHPFPWHSNCQHPGHQFQQLWVWMECFILILWHQVWMAREPDQGSCGQQAASPVGSCENECVMVSSDLGNDPGD